MRKLTLLFFLFVLSSRAQDIHFSQSINAPLHINPANAGAYEGYERVILNYRNQWSSFNAAYKTMGFSFDTPLLQSSKGNKAHIGLGFSFFSDKAGDANFGISMGAITAAAIVPIDREFSVSAGVQYGLGQRSADISRIQFGNQFNGTEYDPTMVSGEGNSVTTFLYSDLAVGFRAEYKTRSENLKGWSVGRASLGVAYYHANKPSMKYLAGSEEKLNAKLVVHGMGYFDLPNRTYSLVPFFTWFSQGPLRETNYGMLVKVQLRQGTKVTGYISDASFYVGAQRRSGDAWIPYLMFEMNPFSIGLTYDYNTSTLKTVSRGNGGFEISLKYHNLSGPIWKRRS